MTSVTYDTSGKADISNLSGSAAAQTQSYSAASGADVFWALAVGSATAPTSVTFNGQTLTWCPARPRTMSGLTVSVICIAASGWATVNPHNFSAVIPARTWVRQSLSVHQRGQRRYP